MRTTLLLFLAVAISGCGMSSYFVPLNPTPHPLVSRPPEAVPVLATGRPEKPAVDVGLFTIRANLSNAAERVAFLREEAGRMGCDIVSLVDIGGNYLRAGCFVYLAPKSQD